MDGSGDQGMWPDDYLTAMSPTRSTSISRGVNTASIYRTDMSGQMHLEQCWLVSTEVWICLPWSIEAHKNLQEYPWLAQHGLTEVQNISRCHRLTQVSTVSRTKQNTRAQNIISRHPSSQEMLWSCWSSATEDHEGWPLSSQSNGFLHRASSPGSNLKKHLCWMWAGSLIHKVNYSTRLSRSKQRLGGIWECEVISAGTGLVTSCDS